MSRFLLWLDTDESRPIVTIISIVIVGVGCWIS